MRWWMWIVVLGVHRVGPWLSAGGGVDTVLSPVGCGQRNEILPSGDSLQTSYSSLTKKNYFSVEKEKNVGWSSRTAGSSFVLHAANPGIDPWNPILSPEYGQE